MDNSGLNAIQGMSSLNVLRRVKKILHKEYDLVSSDISIAVECKQTKQDLIAKIIKEVIEVENEFLK